jgi:hypothetical protein
MNLTFRYARQKYDDDIYGLLGYFTKLAVYNKKLIMKYCQLIDVEEVYSRMCVKKLPLTLSYKEKLPSCTNPKNCVRYYYDSYGNRRVESDTKCLKCWICTLERIDEIIDKELILNLPSFLKSKSKQTTRPTSLLKKKTLPSCLK